MNFAIIIINRHLFVNLLLVMKYHCYIIQPLQSCEIWIPSPMSNFFAESPKLYKRWQGCSFNHIWKEGQTQFHLLQILEPISQEGLTQFLILLCNCLNPHHTPGESDQELCFSGRRIRLEDQNMLRNVYQWSKKKDEVLIEIWNDRWQDPRADRHEVLKETDEPAQRSHPGENIVIKHLIMIIININW